jgi:hypothetical protein
VAIRTICTAIVLASLSSAAAAAASDAFDACASVTDATARVACFDHALAERRAAQHVATPTATATTPPAAPVAPPPPSHATPAPAPAQAADSDVGLTALQLRKQHEARGEPDPPPPSAITAKLVRVIARQPLISVFELDNGQVWEQSEAMKLSAEPPERVTISHGLLGAFFLKTAAGVVVRVRRVK